MALETLYELMVTSVRDMLAAYDTRQDNMIAFKAFKKQVESLLDAIEEKRKEAVNKN